MTSAEKLFWTFVHERQEIWHKREVLKEPGPWTDDPVLQNLRFTNVYRHLDRGTLFAVYEILEKDAPWEDRLFNLLFYRRHNKIETALEYGFLRLRDLDLDDVEEKLRDRDRRAQESGKFTVCTGSYQSNLSPRMGGRDLAENLRRFAESYADTITRIGSELKYIGEHEYAKRAFQWIRRNVTGYGHFLTYQLIADMGTPLLRNYGRTFLGEGDPSDYVGEEIRGFWTAPGPGAIKAAHILRPGWEPADVVRELWHRQDWAFDKLGLPFRRPIQGEFTAPGTSTEPVFFDLPDIEHCLCEFFKYHRGTTQGTKGQRHYHKPQEPQWRPPHPMIPAWA